MRKARHPNVRFLIGRVDGYFTNNGWSNRHNTVFSKKTKALVFANQILLRQGQVYIKVTYGKKLYNDGIYTTKKNLEEALSAFTEMSLIKYALEDE